MPSKRTAALVLREVNLSKGNKVHNGYSLSLIWPPNLLIYNKVSLSLKNLEHIKLKYAIAVMYYIWPTN